MVVLFFFCSQWLMVCQSKPVEPTPDHATPPPPTRTSLSHNLLTKSTWTQWMHRLQQQRQLLKYNCDERGNNLLRSWNLIEVVGAAVERHRRFPGLRCGLRRMSLSSIQMTTTTTTTSGTTARTKAAPNKWLNTDADTISIRIDLFLLKLV